MEGDLSSVSMLTDIDLSAGVAPIGLTKGYSAGDGTVGLTIVQ
jgi:hypothetical protein